ncbi:hypothetical protein [Clostridium moutaii]|uniref:hypothetical protein n=1 Tax=Clostridium moutaii TaxID=3240932 RepID=UPI00350F34B2
MKILEEENQLPDKKSTTAIKFSISLKNKYIQSKCMSGTIDMLALYILDIYLD